MLFRHGLNDAYAGGYQRLSLAGRGAMTWNVLRARSVTVRLAILVALVPQAAGCSSTSSAPGEDAGGTGPLMDAAAEGETSAPTRDAAAEDASDAAPPSADAAPTGDAEAGP